MTLWDLYEKSKREVRVAGKVQESGDFRQVSLVVIGKILRECFCPEIEFEEGEEEISFEQIWHLVCEYHEKGRGKPFGAPELRTVRYPDFDMEKRPVYFADGSRVERSSLTEEDVIDFFYYRKICCKKRRMDHGIAGGLLLYQNFYAEEAGECGGIANYAAITLVCHNAFAKNREGICSWVREDPLLCLLLLAEAMGVVCFHRGSLNRGAMKRLFGALGMEPAPGSLTLFVNPDVIPFADYAEKLHCIAIKTGICVSTDEKNYKIHIKDVNSDDY